MATSTEIAQLAIAKFYIDANDEYPMVVKYFASKYKFVAYRFGWQTKLKNLIKKEIARIPHARKTWEPFYEHLEENPIRY